MSSSSTGRTYGSGFLSSQPCCLFSNDLDENAFVSTAVKLTVLGALVPQNVLSAAFVPAVFIFARPIASWCFRTTEAAALSQFATTVFTIVLIRQMLPLRVSVNPFLAASLDTLVLALAPRCS